MLDSTLRRLAALDVGAFCRWIGEPPGEIVRVSEALPVGTEYVDLLCASSGGDGGRRLTHIEFARDATGDLPLRMLGYRARVMRHPDFRGWPVFQHIIVLKDGTIRDELVDGDRLRLRLRFEVHYLRHADPEELLAVPSLAPLATIARAASGAERAELLARTLRSIRESAPTADLEDLAGASATLAGLYLDAGIIDTIWREAHMPIDVSDSSVIRRALDQGWEKGREEGREEGQAGLVVEMLGARFGADPRLPTIAARLAKLTPAEIHRQVNAAASLDELDSSSE